MTDYHYLFKFIVVGDSGAGKSSLLRRYTDDVFDGSFLATIGTDFFVKSIETADGKRIKLQLWDLAGSSKFRTIVSSYYRGADGVVLVYDVTDPTSLANLTEWISDIERFCPPDVPMILIGNKCDLITDKAVSSHQGQEFADKYNSIPFLETSAKTNINVSKAFRLLTEDVLPKKTATTSMEADPSVKKVIHLGGKHSLVDTSCCRIS